jgi:putative transposase
VTKPHRPPIRFSRLPAGVQHAGAGRIERQQPRGTVTDLLHVTDAHWSQGHYGFLCIQHLDKQLGRRLQVSSRTVERWLRIYRKNPDVMALMPRARGPSIGHRRITPERENLLAEVIDAWARRGQRLPVAWIREECGHRGRALGIKPVSRGCIEARLRDLGIESLQRVRPPRAMPAGVPKRPPRSKGALGIVQIDHTLVDVMVVDEVRRQSMGRPWITVAFDIATRAVLGFHLSLNAPSSISVGLTLAMVGLPRERWLVERGIEVEWPMFGIPRLLHLDNGAEFHSVALSRGCERYGISLE